MVFIDSSKHSHCLLVCKSNPISKLRNQLTKVISRSTLYWVEGGERRKKSEERREEEEEGRNQKEQRILVIHWASCGVAASCIHYIHCQLTDSLPNSLTPHVGVCECVCVFMSVCESVCNIHFLWIDNKVVNSFVCISCLEWRIERSGHCLEAFKSSNCATVQHVACRMPHDLTLSGCGKRQVRDADGVRKRANKWRQLGSVWHATHTHTLTLTLSCSCRNLISSPEPEPRISLPHAAPWHAP